MMAESWGGRRLTFAVSVAPCTSAALDLNILGANGIVAAGVPIGAGAALAQQAGEGRPRRHLLLRRRRRQPGRGPRDHEPGGRLKLPSSSSCENNKYALSTDQSRTTAARACPCARATYGIPPLGGRQRSARRVRGGGRGGARARRGEGPSCVEAGPIAGAATACGPNLPDYRTKQEELEWMEKDPVARVERRLTDMGVGESGSRSSAASGRRARRLGGLRDESPDDGGDHGGRGLRAARARDGARGAGPAAR